MSTANDYTPLLNKWMAMLLATVPAPKSVKMNGGYCYRFVEKSCQQAIVQKLARITSGLNAIYLLNRHGFLQEQATLQRTLDEFVEDVEFLALGILNNDITTLHSNFLEGFYDEISEQPWDKSKFLKGRNMPTRKKIRAYLAESTKEIHDKNTAINAAAAISHTYSGYVHGYASQIMEMYLSNPPGFLTNGMLSSPLCRDHTDDLNNYLLRAVYAVAFAAKALNHETVFNEAYKEAKKLEQTTLR